MPTEFRAFLEDFARACDDASDKQPQEDLYQ